jgi:hypothetical protein
MQDGPRGFGRASFVTLQHGSTAQQFPTDNVAERVRTESLKAQGKLVVRRRAAKVDA